MNRLHGISPLQTLVISRLEQSSQRVQRQVFDRPGNSERALKHLQGRRSCQASWVRGLSACFVSLMLCLNWGFASAADMGVAETKAVIAKAMGISQRLSEPDRQRAQDMFNAAIELMKAKEYKAAAAQFQKGLAIDPGNRNANHNLARLLEVTGDADGATLHYRLATGLAAGQKSEPLPDFDCPVQMGMDETQFPGFEPKNPMSFIRDQGSVGNCDQKALSDLFCFHANKQKSFSSRGLPNSACSAADLMLQSFEVRKKSFESIEQMLKGDPEDKESVLEYNRAYQPISDYMSSIGLCLEQDFPSDPRDSDRQYDFFKTLLQFSSAVNKAASEGRTLNPLCDECQLIAPNIKRSSPYTKLAIKNLSSNSYLALRQLNKIACSSENRVSLDKIKIKQASLPWDIRDQVRYKNPVLVQIDPGILLSRNLYEMEKAIDPKIDKSLHSVLVIGARAAFGRCYYVVKNSWSQKACEEDPFVRGESPRLLCNKKTGAVLVLGSNLEGSRNFSAFWVDQTSP